MIRITPGLTEKFPQDKLSMLPPGQAFLISSVTFFRGFMPKKATFITTTVSVTAAMDTQKTMLSPNKPTFPNSAIQIFFRFIVYLLLQQLAVVTNIGFFQAGRQHHVEQDADTRFLHS